MCTMQDTLLPLNKFKKNSMQDMHPFCCTTSLIWLFKNGV